MKLVADLEGVFGSPEGSSGKLLGWLVCLPRRVANPGSSVLLER